jgi:zinc finger protein
MTRLFLTKIPFFREIVIMSFSCEHCGFKDSEIQPAGEIQQQGHKFTLKVENTKDMNRQIVKSDTCIFRIEELDLEVPPGKGQLTNVEGILSTIAEDLGMKQDERKEVDSELFEKIDVIITSLKSMTEGTKFPFTVTADDPAGNSWIERSPSDTRGKHVRSDYPRSEEQNIALGLAAQNEEEESSNVEMRPEYHAQRMEPAMPDRPMVNNVDDDDIVENQVYTFPATCPGCMKSCDTHMKMVNIPHFKQVVIMSTVCDHCGYRSNEVKTGGEVPETGRRITVSVSSVEDMNRDILKSESCALNCPELELSVEPGTLGGRFTTIEGLLTQVRDDLKSNIFDFGASGGGDSMDTAEKDRWTAFFDKLDAAIQGREKFTMILEDPLGGSYVQSLAEAGTLDAAMKIEEYERTEEEEESLGLRDIKTEGYVDEVGLEKEKEAAAAAGQIEDS